MALLLSSMLVVRYETDLPSLATRGACLRFVKAFGPPARLINCRYMLMRINEADALSGRLRIFL
jgi:hypothetical protein